MLEYEKLRPTLEKLRVAGKTIVLVTGVFDILHAQHIIFLEKARAIGDVLLVGIESDARVTKMKGAGRPINTADKRRQALQKLPSVTNVFVLPEDFNKPQDHIRLIETIRPSFLAVSSHTAHLDKKRAILEAVGGRVVVVHEHEPSISTTKLLAQ